VIEGEPEYAIRQTGPRRWEVWKLEGHHMKSLTMYEVKILGERMYCSCPAGNSNCKHMTMVKNFNKPKKDLF